MFNRINKILSNNLLVLVGLSIIIFFSYSSLFNSYFESDEWFYFTYYYPLTQEPYGAIIAVISTIIDSDYISGGQHVVPFASLIYFLNTKILGLNFVFYVFMSLLLHSINSFLVFLFIKALFNRKKILIQNLFAILGATFFAISSIPMHAITWAGFYGQNVLSVTFFLLCVLCFEVAFNREKIKFIYFSLFFLILALFTKESTFFLFLLLPLMVILEKRAFSLRLLGKFFIIAVTIFAVFRFLIPNINTFSDMIVDSYLSTGSVEKTITINKLKDEIIFRTLTFPIKITGSLFVPPENAMLSAQILAPVIVPVPPGGDQITTSAFINYSGPSTVIYLVSLVVIFFTIASTIKLIRKKKSDDAKVLIVGFLIMILGALPLVPIILTFPTWGYATFFESRHLYNPSVGAAIIFPFILFGLSNFVSKIIKTRNVIIIVALFFTVWLIYNTYAFNKSIKVFAQNYGKDRREIVKQLKDFMPELSQRTVFYFEKDGKAPFASLPFFTSVPQALTVVYYKESSLPKSFYNKPLFSGEPEGYQFSENRGFGFYITKQKLMEDLYMKKFELRDIYGFYYYGEEARIESITNRIRNEAEIYLENKYE